MAPHKNPLRAYQCQHCGEPGETHSPNKPYCDDSACREDREAKAKARIIAEKASKRGRVTVDEKTAQIAVELMKGTRPEDLPAHLMPTVHAGIPKLRDTPERRTDYLANLRRLGNASASALATDGIPGTAKFFRGLASKDSKFASEVRAALDSYGAIVAAQGHKLAIEGVDEPLVSMGEIVGHKKVYSEKILLAMMRKHDKELAAANSGGGNATVNVSVSSGIKDLNESGEPQLIVSLSEAFTLAESDRRELTRIYRLILERRAAIAGEREPAQISLEPPQEYLDLQADEIEEESPDDI